MSEQSSSGAAQFRADLPKGVEQESVRTTIVGGRPPGSGQPIGAIPRGIEVLVKKAAVDEEFRRLLLDDPNQAAMSIELELEPVESAMLKTFPKEQLAVIIDKTEVPQLHRRAFLGQSAATMVALLGGITLTVGCPKGCRGDYPRGLFPYAPVPPDDDTETSGKERQIHEDAVQDAQQQYMEPQRFSFGLEVMR